MAANSTIGSDPSDYHDTKFGFGAHCATPMPLGQTGADAFTVTDSSRGHSVMKQLTLCRKPDQGYLSKRKVALAASKSRASQISDSR